MDCTKVNLKKGSSGAQVKELQRYLTFLGYYDGKIDGEYGSYTEAGVIKMQKAYGNTADGWFGPKTCKACGINGQDISNSIQNLTLETFKNMKSRYDTYIKENKTEPKICYIDISTKYRYVTNAKFKDMVKRYEAFKEANGKEPLTVYITLPYTSTSTTSNTTWIKNLKAVIGDFTTFKGFYNNLKGKGYAHYNNDVYTFDQCLERLKKGQGINCSDACQMAYRVAKEIFGLTVRYVHIICVSGEGHIVLDVKYPQGASSYTRIDPAAALSKGSQYAFGNIWCAKGRVISYDDPWLMTDDGKT